ncbi:rhomboid family intramembrane serine protease [Corynebacterium timonense]|uniref:Rhomboid family protein n=1 Tax=Corynebacterium timonense TaxID=441500 RepID=A0A1H1U8Y5_9CORY|nr:rhomboid family intramembrane serine protease [Corynebacterium timonense]SDS68962.1 Rhomboid family protein [Corynebacterium timonense]
MNAQRIFAGAPVTALACALCAIVFVAAALPGTGLRESMYLFGPYAAEGWGWLRALTSGFMHLDLPHVALNVLMLALIGAEVERFVGSRAYALAYLAGLLGSSAAVLAMNFTTPTAGASGVLYMLMALLVGIAYRRQTDLRPAFALIAVNLVYSLIAPGVSLWGHIGGMLMGIVLAYPLTSQDGRVRALGAAGGVVLGGVAVGLLLA